jgi:putative N6-adenine-specific DNA methylase
MWRANLELRVATRVLARAGEVRARDFAKLRRGVAALDWRAFARGAPRIECTVSARRCRLYHTGAIAERVAGGIADRLGAPAADAPVLDVFVRGEDDVFMLSVDTSGELLHRRGWRVDTAMASLRETLAAGLLALAGWTRDESLVDPMCGAGTIAIEAALAALDRPAGAGRAFAFQAFPGFDRPAYDALLAARLARARATLPAPIVAGDRDPRALELARRNAERAGVAAQLVFHTGDAAALPLPPSPGLLLANPPYGRRLSAGPQQAAFSSLGALARRARGFRLAALLPAGAPHALRALRLPPPRARLPLQNGGLRVELVLFDPVV